ncbi:hypothetical protein [Arthrobacter mobilis]|uniref:Uncharacterized protein n=1 Tax=Arthrobacter mobilis TaxID=2724944 RepID=A0A7X6HF73_9MICC|nr:hypothetical protein [Arthrobacter mobilis]NKX55936.1 hypothetical protein [Arthrobacter mobilis]
MSADIEGLWASDPERFRRVQHELGGPAAVLHFAEQQRRIKVWRRKERREANELLAIRGHYEWLLETQLSGWQKEADILVRRMRFIEDRLASIRDGLSAERERLSMLAAPVLERIAIEAEVSASALAGGAL